MKHTQADAPIAEALEQMLRRAGHPWPALDAVVKRGQDKVAA